MATLSSDGLTLDQLIKLLNAGTTIGSLLLVGGTSSRFENVLSGAPTGASGVGLEVGVTGGAAWLQSYDRTAVAPRPLELAGSRIGLTINGTEVAAFTTGGALSLGTNPATTGILNLPNAALVAFRNAANNADVTALSVDASNRVVLAPGNAAVFVGSAGAAAVTMGALSAAAGTFSGAVSITGLATFQDSIVPGTNDALTLGVVGTGWQALTIQHAANRATGLLLVQTLTGAQSPRIMFENTTDWAGHGVVLMNGASDSLDFRTGASVGSASGTVRLNLTATALNVQGTAIVGTALLTLGSGATTEAQSAEIRIRSGDNAAANNKDSFVSYYRNTTELWRVGQLGSSGSTLQRLRIMDRVNNIVHTSFTAGATLQTLIVSDSFTTQAIGGMVGVNAGTNTGANDKDAYFEMQRGQTPLWRMGVLGSLATDGSFRLRDVANSLTPIVVSASTQLVTLAANLNIGTATGHIVAVNPSGALTDANSVQFTGNRASFGFDPSGPGGSAPSSYVLAGSGKGFYVSTNVAGGGGVRLIITSPGDMTLGSTAGTGTGTLTMGALTASTGTFSGNLVVTGGTIKALAAATQDAVALQGRAGGSGSFVQTITTALLTGSRTLTLADAATTLVGGTMVPDSRTITIAGTANQVSSSAGALDLSANRTWTLSLPQDIHTGASPTFAGLTLGALVNAPGTGAVLAARQAANGNSTLILQRQTDTAPTGDFLSFYDVGATPAKLFNVSVAGAITVGTIPASAVTGVGALTKTDDTNVTLTLGGSPSVALLAAASLTLGWTGTLAVARGGTGVASLSDVIGTANQVNVAGGVARVAGGNVTLSLPQNIHTGATPQFAGLGIGVAGASGTAVVVGTIKALAAATQDAVILQGRAGGTSSFAVTLIPTTLTASRTLTLADGATTLVAGTMVATSRALTMAGTTNQVAVSAGAQDLSADRTWTFSLPQNIHTAAAVNFASVTTTGNIQAQGNVFAGVAGTGTGGSFQSFDDGGTRRWLSGFTGATGARNWAVFDIVNGRETVNIDATTGRFTTDFDLAVASLGVFDSTAAPTKDYVLSYNGTKWVPRNVQFSFNSSAVTAGILGDGTAATYAFVTPTYSGTPSAPATPTLTATYKSMVVDMGATPPAGSNYVVDYSINGGAFTSNAILSTGQKVVHSGLDPTKTYAYKVKLQYASSTYTAYSAATSATNPSVATEVNAFGLIVASQIATAELSAITASLGYIRSVGAIENAAQDAGLWLGATAALSSRPVGWKRYLDLVDGTWLVKDATGTSRVLAGKTGSDFGFQAWDVNGATICDFTGSKRIFAIPVQNDGDKSGTFTVDLSTGVARQIRLTASGSVLQFSNPTDGMRFRLWLQQDEAGSHTGPTFADQVMFEGDTPPVLSTTPGAIDIMEVEYRAANSDGAASPRYLLKPYSMNQMLPTPSVQNVTTSSNTTSIAMPASTVAGELLLIVFTTDTSGAAVATPSGWTSLLDQQYAAATRRARVLAKVADGTEGGTSVTLAVAGSAHVYRVSRWHGSLSEVKVATATTGTSVNPDPGSLTTSIVDRHLWIAAALQTGSPSVSVYPLGTGQTLTAGSAGGAIVATCRAPIYALTKDVGAFTTSLANAWLSITVAVRPPA